MKMAGMVFLSMVKVLDMVKMAECGFVFSRYGRCGFCDYGEDGKSDGCYMVVRLQM